MTRYVVVGGGIIGLATARALLQADPRGQLTLLEKEPELAQHQTGRNSGVIHSGIYYPPGSAKAVMCRAGAASMKAYAEQHGIPVERTGKLIVATEESELPGLAKLHERALANGIEVDRLGPEQAREYEPFVAALAALRVHSTAITDYSAVCRALAGELTEAGAQLRLSTAVRRLVHTGSDVTTVLTDQGEVTADVLVNCAGLQSDRVAATDRAGSGPAPDARIGTTRPGLGVPAGRAHDPARFCRGGGVWPSVTMSS